MQNVGGSSSNPISNLFNRITGNKPQAQAAQTLQNKTITEVKAGRPPARPMASSEKAEAQASSVVQARPAVQARRLANLQALAGSFDKSEVSESSEKSVKSHSHHKKPHVEDSEEKKLADERGRLFDEHLKLQNQKDRFEGNPRVWRDR